MAKLNAKQAEVLLEVRKRGTSYAKRAEVTLRALERKGLIVRGDEPIRRVWELTDAALEHLPADIPRTKAPVHTYWMHAEVPYDGPHAGDTRNGYIYRFIRITDGVPSHAGYELESLFREKYDHQWSWGNKGLKCDTVQEARAIAVEVLGSDFKGSIGSS
jgi:hypothetical protein